MANTDERFQKVTNDVGSPIIADAGNYTVPDDSPPVPFEKSLLGRGVGAVKSAIGTFSDVSKMNTPGYQGEYSGALAANPTVSTEPPPRAMSELGGRNAAIGEMEVVPPKPIIGPEEAPRTTTPPGSTSVIEEGPMKPTVSTFDKGAGYTPGGSEVIPSGGGYQGFVDSEMAKIQKDRAEYEAHLRSKEEERLAGIGPEGQEKMRKRIQEFAPYLEGVSKGRKAKIMAGFMGKLIEEEGAGSRELLKTRAGTSAALGAAQIKADATRQAAFTKAQTEAQKMGIDVAKLGLQEKALGIRAFEAKEKSNFMKAQIQDFMTKTNVIEPMKIALKQASNDMERNKIRAEYIDKALSGIYAERMKNIRQKYEFNMESDAAKREIFEATKDRITGSQLNTLWNPFEGANTMGATFSKGKWIINPQEEEGE